MPARDSASRAPDREPTHSERLERRAAALAQRRRARRRAGAGVLGVVVVLVAGALRLSEGGAGSPGATAGGGRPGPAPSRAARSGGPLAPAASGGLASLWAPGNVVGIQPGTSAAYAAASTRPGPAGYILIADRGNNRILVVDARHRVAFRYPDARDVSRGRLLHFNDDTFVAPGGASLIANEEENQAIVSIGLADHSLRVLFGHPGQIGAGRTHLNTPDDAYALPDGSFTVADAYNCRILFIRAGRIERQYGRAGTCRHAPPDFLGAVNGDTPTPDGGVMISEIPGHWVDEIGPDGQLRFAVRAPVSYPSDPQPLPGGRILLADYASPGHVLIIDRTGRVLWRYGPATGPGRMDHPSLAMALPNGNIAVNDDFRNRVIVIDPRLRRIVWQYGRTDQPGTGPNRLNTPDGMDFIPAGPDGRPDFAAVVHP